MAGNQKNFSQKMSDQHRVQKFNQSDGETSQDLSGSSANSFNQGYQNGLNLDDLKTMFKSAIDPEVVEMIWQDSNRNCDIALGFLTEMSPKAVPIAATLKSNSWANVLGGPDTSKPFTVNQGVKPKSSNKIIHPAVETIKNRLNSEKILIIMRGVPGSGKSFLARQLRGHGVVLSTDDFFINFQGEYVFDRYRLQEAHEWNQRRADERLRDGTNPVVIDNTNLEIWEMQPYVVMALR